MGYEFGFKKKADVYKWMFDTYFITQADWEKYGWYDFRTAAGANVDELLLAVILQQEHAGAGQVVGVEEFA